MVKVNSFTPPSPTLLASLAPRPASYWPTQTPRTDPPGTPFPFLRLPPEIRQQIYALLLPTSLVYHSLSATSRRWNWVHRRERIPPSYLALFLTNQQICHESAETLWRLCTVRVETRWRRRAKTQGQQSLLLHALDTWSESARWCVKRVQRDYEGSIFYLPAASDSNSSAAWPSSAWSPTGYYWDATYGWLANEEYGDVDVLFAMYNHLVAEARAFERYLPSLRVCTAGWPAFENGMMQRFGGLIATMRDAGREESRNIVRRLEDALVKWLRVCVGDGVFRAPKVLRIGFGKQTNETEDVERCWRRGVMRDALATAQNEVATRQVSAEELEGNGARWLEGLSGKRKRGRKGWIEE